MLTLYDYFRSSASFRVRIALSYKELPYGKIPIDLRIGAQTNPQYTELNPEGLVPLLDDDGQLITQSIAIIEYLDERHNALPLLPKDILGSSYVRSIAFNICCDIHPLNNLRVRNYLTNTLQCTKEQSNEWCQHWMNIGLDSLEKQISQSKFYTGKYCYLDQFTMADICLIPQLFNLRRFMSDLGMPHDKINQQINEHYPTLAKIEENCQQLEAVKLAWPKE